MQIAPGVHQVRMLGADSFLLEEDRLTLIDAGMVGSRLMLERYLRRIGRRLDELDRIICTHGHPDHIGGVGELVRDRDDIAVLIHPDDLAGLTRPLREAMATAESHGERRGRIIQYLTRTPADPTPVEHGDVLQVVRGRLTYASAFFSHDHAGARGSVERLAALDVEMIALSHYPPWRVDANAALRELADRAAE